MTDVQECRLLMEEVERILTENDIEWSPRDAFGDECYCYNMLLKSPPICPGGRHVWKTAEEVAKLIVNEGSKSFRFTVYGGILRYNPL